MKTFTFATAAALFFAVMFSAFNVNPVAEAQSTRCDDAPGTEGYNDEITSSSSSCSSSSSPKKYGDVVGPLTETLLASNVLDEPTEVSVDGTCVLSKSGPDRREWMNKFPWKRSQDKEYQLHVKVDGMEVRLGEKRVWGVPADEMMG